MVLDDFKPIEIQHREIFKQFLFKDPPQTSELAFTNFFIWRHQYHPLWLQWENCLLIVLRPDGIPPFGLPPIGPGDKGGALDILVERLKNLTPEVKVCRVSEDFIEKHMDQDRYVSFFDRDNSDYVYSTQDLIRLSGRKYHRKKNQLNRFLKNYWFEYREMDKDLVENFLNMQENWCRIKECSEKTGPSFGGLRRARGPDPF